MGIVQLHPLAHCELLAQRPHLLEDLLAGNPGRSATLARPTAPRRAKWYRNNLDTLVLRDVRNLARIRSVNALPFDERLWAVPFGLLWN